MIRDIVLHLSSRTSGVGAMNYAVSVAGAFEAHLSGIAFALDAFIPPSTGMGDVVPPEWIEEDRAEAENAASAAIAAFEEAARRNGISAGSRRIDASLGGAAETFGRMARRFDISIVRQAEPGKTPLEELIIEAALFDSGRPVLVVPYIQKDPLKLDRVTICWDGGRNAARAAADALPFLERAKTVDVVMVRGEAGKSDEIPGADIGEHLARHGLRAEVKQVVAAGGDVTDTLLSYAADAGTDFLVMGGYGHSRLREFILGGVTRGILASMTVPVLMSH